MKKQDENQLKLEISHIFESGANEIRVFKMVKDFINKRFSTQGPTAVSAEEMLNKFVGIYVDDNVDKVYLKSDVIKAMQEYANASKREHAIGFAEWIGKNGFYKNASETNLLLATNDNANYWGCLYTNEELYTDYLKTLTIKE